MQDSIFREYDIRGKTDSELVIDQVYNLTRSIAAYFIQTNPAVKKIVVGMDGRLTSPAIKDHMIAALQDCGFDVIFIGICPSPVLYFALYTMQGDAGLMITASHNPKEYNGIKICLGKSTIWGKQIKEIGKLYREKNYAPLSQIKGTLQDYPLIPQYISWLKEHFSSLIGLSLEFIIDSGNGAGGTVIPDLVAAMQWNHVSLLCAEVDGTYPNHEADPTVEKNMADVKNTLATTQAAFGIGLDGDCDRMAAMTKSGFLIPGDQLLAVFAQDILKTNPGRSIVFDVKVSSGLIELLKKWDAKPVMSPCGHAIIKEKMHEHHAILGGELSCHFFFKDRHFGFDDGIYAMMRLLEIIHKSGKSLDELIKIFPKKYSSPEIRIPCNENKKQIIVEYLIKLFENRSDAEILTIDGLRLTLPYGWASVRASNTQPVLSIRYESDTPDGLVRIKQEIIEALKKYLDEKLLKEKIL